MSKSKIQFGVITLNRGPHSSAENLARYATRAEALGYDFIGVNDHLVIPRTDPEGHEDKHWTLTHDYFEALQLCLYIAGMTKRIRIGPSVLVLPYRLPLLAAKMISTLDVFSGGRFFLGVGTGWWPQEFAALGLGDHFASRGERTDEHLRIFKTVWTQDVASFAGKYYQFENLEFSPKPVQKPGPPIWIGGNNPRAHRRMAEFGDVWHPNASPYRPDLMPPTGLGPSRDKVVRAFEKVGRNPATLEIALRRPVRITKPGTPKRADFDGPPEAFVEGIHGYQEGGMTSFAITPQAEHFDGVLEQLEIFAEHVIPQFR